MSDDGQHGLTLIAFVGSVFSSYYAHSRRKGNGDPVNHCALNVALYGSRGKRWAFTERGRDSLRRNPTMLTLGPSSLYWDGNVLTARINEITAPFPSRIRGTIRLYPTKLSQCDYALDPNGCHRWGPIAPSARVKVDLERPALQWSGQAYHDSNAGSAPLERDFSRWNWCRADVGDDTVVLYNVTRRNAEDLRLALRFNPDGAFEEIESPPDYELPRTLWRMRRETCADAGHAVSVIDTLEDAPFYSRSVLATRLLGERTTAVHESLCLDRFRSPWVQMLVPFRNPRAWR